MLPGFGLLADDFAEPYLQHYELQGDTCIFSPDIHIPYEPFCGVMGVAPRENGRFTTIAPGEHGGNIDIRHLTPGLTAWFPVWVPGALSRAPIATPPRATARSTAQASSRP